MRVAELWRYPIKSLRGERCARLALDEHGVAGDRRYAFRSTAAPVGKPLLHTRERTRALLHTPLAHDLALTSVDLAEPGATLTLLHAATPLTDVRPVALHALDDLQALERSFGAAVDGRRFRSNLVVDTLACAAPGRLLSAPSGATLRLTEPIPRCRIVSLSPDTAEADPSLLRHLARHHGNRFGWYATVLQPGPLQVGELLKVGQA